MKTLRVVCAVFVLLIGIHVYASVFGSDILGDGDLNCYPKSTCPTTVGNVASPALVSGSLQANGSTLGLQIATTPILLTFSDPDLNNPDPIVGPLGLNLLYNPTKISPVSNNATRDATIPVSGQQLTLNIKNTGTVALTEIDFYLQDSAHVLPNGQTDGMTFGIYCTGLPDTDNQPTGCPSSLSSPALQNLKLLMTPTGPGTLNPADTNPSTATFGDLLRFSGVNLAPNATGTFSFYITDNNGTRAPGTGGGTPNPSFTLQIVPTPVPTYRISGKVSLGANGLGSTTVALSGSLTASTSTDSSGNFSFTNLVAGNYTVTASKAGYTFAPPSQTFNSLAANQTANFAATAVYTISGKVSLGSVGLSGVNVALSGSQTASTSTDAQGNYSFANLPTGNYVVTPSKTGYAFTAPSQTFTSLAANQTANFTAAAVYTISGTVSLASSGLSGVTVALSGSQTASTSTDAQGNYSFANLPTGNYVVTPSKTGYTFTAPSQTFTSLAANQTANFTATAVYTISGTVSLASAGLSGVTVALSGAQTASTSTDSSGNYSFANLPNGNYTVTPSKTGYTFTPPSQALTNLAANGTANFSAGISATLSLSRSLLNFGYQGSLISPTQSFTVSFTGNAPIAWTASSNQPNIVVNPASGTGTGIIHVSAAPGASGEVTVTATGVSNSPQQVQIHDSSVTAPQSKGSVDIPADGTVGIAGSIALGGWAIDTIGLARVDIYRDAAGSEPVGLVFLASAQIIPGSRPDIVSAFPDYPLNDIAGWGYLMLTNFLPNNIPAGGDPGNGTYRLHVYAIGLAGNSSEIGAPTITVDNAHASRPFGTLDTPGQGGIMTGNPFLNFGWALTQNPHVIPLDGSTITVTVDGQNLGHPVYNNYRVDIATAFPGLANSNGAVGYYFIDTSKIGPSGPPIPAGLHTIGWVVYDNAGRGDGIGSRYFSLPLTGATAAPEEPPTKVAIPSEIRLRRGFDQNRQPELLRPDAAGVHAFEIAPSERIELPLGAAAGYLLVDGLRQPLPVGSSLKDGVFYWFVGPGFLGEYPLLFERPDGSSVAIKITVGTKRSEQ